MTARRVVTGALLLFVAVSLVTIVAKEVRRGRARSAPRTSGGAVHADASAPNRIVAYYLVGKFRCNSCRTIERVARETVESSFSRELADGRLRFVTVDFSKPENAHFIEDFKLDSSSLVLAEYRGGRMTSWKNLPEVWPLVENERGLADYVRKEVTGRLGGL